MELEDYFGIIKLPLLFLLFLDLMDFMASHYSSLKESFPAFYVDAAFFVIAIPVYGIVAYSIIMKQGGDREDAAIVAFMLSGSKWVAGWLGAFAFHLLVSSGLSPLPAPLTAISNPFGNFPTAATGLQFLWHVVGAGIGGFLMGLAIEKFLKRKEGAGAQAFRPA